MLREVFDRQLIELQEDVLALGLLVDRAISSSIEALKKKNLEMSKQIIEGDKEINQKRMEIEEKCLQLIATQQPLAIDLRVIAAALNIISDLERMGDHAEGIAKINLMIGEEPLLKPLIDIPRMAEKTREMLERSLKAFIKKDLDEAKRICEEDDEIDALYDQIFRELLTFMLEDPKTIRRATYLLWAAHNLERIGDRVTNICERIVFLVTGKLEEGLRVSKY